MSKIVSGRCLMCAFVVSLLSLGACGGGGNSDSEISFGGAACESGVSFEQTSGKGYDELYNFENNLNQQAQVVFDTTSQSSECAGLASASQIFPWIRVDLQDASMSLDALKFELVEPGGRNSPILATYNIPDPSKQSIQGTFAYQTDLQAGTVCEVVYSGAYCPQTARGKSNGETAFVFSADGTVDCSVTPSAGGTPTTCRGVLTARNVILNSGFYGE